MSNLEYVENCRNDKSADDYKDAPLGDFSLVAFYGPEQQCQNDDNSNCLVLHKRFVYDTVSMQKNREHTGLVVPYLGVKQIMLLECENDGINKHIN